MVKGRDRSRVTGAGGRKGPVMAAGDAGQAEVIDSARGCAQRESGSLGVEEENGTFV